jgi:hypothetical protein
MRHFYSQSKGEYWVTLTDDLGPNVTDAYPEDTIEVEPQPTPIHTYENGVWVEPDAQVSYDYYSEEVRDLLDITEQSGFPHNVIWPSKPE